MTPQRAQVDRAALYVARLTLEIKRGLRPPGHLQGLLGDGLLSVKWRRVRPVGGTPAGPVTPADIGTPVVSAAGDRADASVPINLGGDHGWAALTVRLQRVQERWTITDLTLLQGGRDYAHTVRREPPVDDPQAPLHRRLRTAKGDRQLVAIAAVVNRSDAGPWGPLLDQLNREIAQLQDRIVLLDRQERSSRARR